MSAPLRRRVLATAGHVDHGKSVLVQALTGTHPDRLPQERARGMSIDLGFAFWQLPDGTPVGIVDVPGHRDFIANMLAGVGLVDAVLLVVAADEGVMPQTREHVAIVDLLGLRAGVVALTKVDLVPDPGRLARRRAEVRALLQGTGLHDAPIVPVSARTGQGLDALTAALAAVLARVPPRPDLGRPRLAIDRAFVLPGFGPVVTGTLVDGALQVGMRVQVLPGGAIARIRNLHSHGRPVTHVQPAARVAANLVGVPRQALGRGRWLVLPGDDEPTTRLDAWVRVLPDAPAALRHNAQVRLHLATARVVARVRVLGDEALRPGASGFVQLLLQQPVVARRGDRFVLRRLSPAATWAGGWVLDPHPPRHKRWAAATRAHLTALAASDLPTVLQALLALHGYGDVATWARRVHAAPEAVAEALQTLAQEGRALAWRTPRGVVFVARDQVARWHARAAQVLDAHHAAHPEQPGLDAAALLARVRVPPALQAAWLAQAQAEGVLVPQGAGWARPGHTPRWPPALARALAQIDAALDAAPPWPAAQRLRARVGPAAWEALLRAGALVPLSPQVVVPQARVRAWWQALRRAFPQGGFTVRQARAVLGLSRRYTLALLTYGDAHHLTRREGEVRYWVAASAAEAMSTNRRA